MSLTLKHYDDFDYTSVLGSLNLHNICIGDTGGPVGNESPKPDPYKDVAYPNYDALSYQKDNEIIQKDLTLKKYKEYVIVNGVKYETSYVQKCVAEYNKTVLSAKHHEIPFTKGFYLLNDFNHEYIARGTLTPLNFIAQLQYYKFEANLEYNTLVKAKASYNKDVAGLNDDYKKAFDIWQKKQVDYFMSEKLPGMCSSVFSYMHKHKTGEDFFRMGGVRDTFPMPDYFNPEVAYDELLNNLLWAKLDLMKYTHILNKIKDEKFDFHSIKENDFDSFVYQHSKWFVKNHRDAYNFLNEQKYIKDFDKFSNESVRCLFKYTVTSVFNEYRMCKYSALNNMSNNLKWGFGLDKQMVFNGCKQIYGANNNTPEKCKWDMSRWLKSSIGWYIREECLNKSPGNSIEPDFVYCKGKQYGAYRKLVYKGFISPHLQNKS